jgi:glycosyltransferase involved in cell wall biosynthesis
LGSAGPSCTVVMLAQNEALRIRSPLDAALATGFEVLVIDGGSSDSTVELASSAGARVLHRPFDNMSTQLNWGIDQLETDYVLVVDADEVISPELASAARAAINDCVDGAWVERVDYFAGRWLTHYPQRHLRFFRRETGRFENEVHQRFVFDIPNPRIVELDGPLAHPSHLSVSGYLTKLNRYTDGEQAADLGVQRTDPRLAWRGGAEGLAMFIRWYFVRGGWRDGSHGFIHSVYLAVYRFTLWAKAATSEQVEPPTSEAAFAAWRARRARP